MKTLTIRAFVVALALTGAVAAAHNRTNAHTMVASTSALPIPLCPPNDPNACGID